jgi:glycosyltransferase involved in cell wall biosynthesis
MNLLINGISSRSGGALVYLSNLIEHILKKNSDIKIYLMIEETFKENFINILSPDEIIYVKKTNIFGRLIKELFLVNFFIKKYNITHMLFPGGISFPTFKSVKKIIVIQNMLPFSDMHAKQYRSIYQKNRLRILKLLTVLSLQKCDAIIFISNFCKSLIVKKYNLEKIKKDVIFLGSQPYFHKKSELKRLIKGSYFTYVSFLDYYKAQIQLIYGYNIYRRKGGSKTLYLIGDSNSEYLIQVQKLIYDLDLCRYIKILPHQTKINLRNIYQNAHVNIFASQVENCPNILFEIMASKQQALISSFSPMPEFAKDTVMYFNSSSIYDISEKLSQADLIASEKSNNNIHRAFLLAKYYSWEVAASKTVDLIRST